MEYLPDYKGYAHSRVYALQKQLEDKNLTGRKRQKTERKCQLYDVLAHCEGEDLCTLFDSTAFNYKVYAYAQEAMKRIGLDVETQEKVLYNIHLAFDEYTAEEALKRLSL